MNQNRPQRVIGFIIKYTWIFCIVLTIMEMSFTVFSATILMQQTAQGVLQSVCGEISGRVDGVLRLLKGLSKDERFADTSKPLFDRAILTRPYKESYNLFMIALTDKDINVVSSNEDDPPKEDFSLAHRDYLQRLYATGNYEITDAFPAGTDGITMNYTIAVPIIRQGVTEGSIFGSIYFDDIENILDRNSFDANRSFYLLGANNTLMADSRKSLYGKDFTQDVQETHYVTATAEELGRNWRNGVPVNFWEWGANGPCYVTSIRVEPTNWTLIYQVQFFPVLVTLLPILWIKIVFYILLCAAISLFGRRYLRKQLAEVSHLWDKVAVMQKEIFQSEQTDYNAFLELSAKGLTDQLTGLSTRTVLSNKIQQFISGNTSFCAVFFIDLDDLKRINDSFGHEAGDCALVHFSKILKQYEQKYRGIASRYGGDEFILILKDLEEQQIPGIADDLCSALRTTITINGSLIPINGSIGISLCPKHGSAAEELICKADLALYTAKQNGKNRFAFYEDSGKASLLL